MPSISNARLTLSESDGVVELRVVYDASFTAVDRQLAGLGLNFHAHTSVHGIDGSVVGPTLAEFERHSFPVTVGPGRQDFDDEEEVLFLARTALGEDPVGDPDELKVKIRVHSPLPPLFTEPAYSDLEVLTSAP